MGGALKKAGPKQTGVKKLPTSVRNKMGYMAKGGMMKKKGYAKGKMVKGAANGGMMKKKGMAAGGKAKGMAKGGKSKVRGAGIAKKGVRPAKMR